uniref:Uncharacterized protein n=1 Tax=Oryza barthii TaxID=65489 RepID=A0A0D3FE62_9ORYZ
MAKGPENETIKVAGIPNEGPDDTTNIWNTRGKWSHIWKLRDYIIRFKMECRDIHVNIVMLITQTDHVRINKRRQEGLQITCL